MKRETITRLRWIGRTSLLACLCAGVAFAQQRGDTTTLNHSMNLQITENGIQLDPSPSVGAASRVEYTRPINSGGLQQPNQGALQTSFIVAVLGSIGINVPSEVIDFANGAGDFSNVSVSPTFTVGIEGHVGGYYEVDSIGAADVGVNAPTQVPVVIPSANTFACGDTIDIDTSAILTNPSMTVVPPNYDMQIGLIARDFDLVARIGLEVDFCVGLQIPSVGCAGYEFSWNSGVQGVSLGTGIPNLEPVLVKFCEEAFAPGADEATLLGCAYGQADILLGLGQQVLDSYNAQHGTNFTFADFEPGSVTVMTPDLPPDAPTLPEMQGTFLEITPADVDFSSINNGQTLRVSGTVSDVSNMEVDAVSFLDYAGYTTSLSLGGGLGSVDIGDIAPTFHVDQEMSFEFSPSIPTTMELAQSMGWQVLGAGGAVVGSGTGTTIPLVAGQTVRLSYPQDRDDPTGAFNTYGLAGSLTTDTKHRYHQSITIRAVEIDVPGIVDFVALQETVGKTELGDSPRQIESHTLNFSSSPVSMPGFALDPEKPILDISDLSVVGVENIGGGQRAIIYRLGLANSGDVNLSNLQADRNFAETFATAPSQAVLCTASSQLGENLAYDGAGNDDLLSPGNTLGVGQNAAIDMLLQVEPEISEVLEGGCFSTVEYSASSTASASSPIGTAISDRYDQCRATYRSDQIVETVNLGAAVIDELTDYTVYGWKKVDLMRGMRLSKGHVGTSGSLRTIRNRRSGDYVPRVVGDMHVAEDLRLYREALEVDNLQIGGDIRYRVAPDELHVSGATSLGSGCVSVMEQPEIVEPDTAGAPDIRVETGEATTIGPGTYEEIYLLEGADITLTAGTYDIGQIRIRDDVTIRLDVGAGPVTINLARWYVHRKRNLRVLVQNGSTRDALINYSHQRKLLFKSAVVQGTLLAPYASVELMENSSLEGAVYASRVKVGEGARFIGHDYLAPVDLHANCQGALTSIRPVQQ